MHKTCKDDHTNEQAAGELTYFCLAWWPSKRAWQPTPVFLENPCGERSLASYSLWGRRVRHNWVTKQSTAQLMAIFECVQRATKNDWDGQKMELPLHNAPPGPAPLLHPLPSLSSYQSPQTATLAAGGKHRESQVRKAAAEVHGWVWTCVWERIWGKESHWGYHLSPLTNPPWAAMSAAAAAAKIDQELIKCQAQCQAL